MNRLIAQVLPLIAIVFVVQWGAGCTSLQSKREHTATGGLEMTLFVRDATQAEEFYQVTPDGTLGWAGGMYARLHSPKWTGPLTEDEIAQLRQLIAERDYFRTKPPSTEEPPKQIYRVLINSPEHRTRFVVKGHSGELEPIRALLAKASLRRLERDLNRLPPPSSQRTGEAADERK